MGTDVAHGFDNSTKTTENMKNYKRFLIMMLAGTALTATAQMTYTVKVTNTMKQVRNDQPVVLQLADDNEVQSALVTLDGKEAPSQLDDLNEDGFYDELCFLANLDKKEQQKFEVKLYTTGEPRQYSPRTFAQLLLRNPKVKEKNKQDFYLTEITVPKELEDPYHMVHQHGVAFESELIAIRVYYDKRQTLDLYGKYNKRLELKDTQFYTTDEQKAQGYGDDILWCGQTFGFGAFRGWDGKQPTMVDDVINRTQRIVAKGPVRTIVELEDRGWKADDRLPRLNMTVRYTLYAGHRDLDVDVFFNRDVTDRNFSTGLINVKNSEEFTDHKGLRGLWGTDFPAGAKDSIAHPRETVGMGIFVPDQFRRSEEPANKDNYGFVVGTDNAQIHYKLVYTSAKETFGYKNSKQWFEFLKQWRKELEHPVVIEYNN